MDDTANAPATAPATTAAPATTVYLTTADSDRYGPAGRFVDLVATDVAADVTDELLVEPTADQLALR